MTDDTRTREDLLGELLTLRRRIAELEAGEPVPDTFGNRMAHEALRETEEKYRVLVQKAQEGIIVNQEGMRRFVNPAAVKIYGRSEEEMVSRPFAEFVHPDDRELVQDRALRRERGEDVPSRYAHRIVTADGRTRWVEINSARISWEGKPAVLVFTTDITESKHMEEAIKEQEDQYRSLVEGCFDGIMVTKETKIILVNSRLCQMLGYSKEELVGIDIWLTAAIEYQNLVKQRTLARMRRENVPSRYEVKVKRSDGSTFDAEVIARPIEIQDKPGVQVWMKDITERKVAEDALRSSEERYRLLVDKAPIGIVSVDPEGRVLEVNQRLVEMLGSPSADATKAINVLSFELMVAAGVSDVFKSCLEQGTAQSAEMPYTTKWGKKVYLRMLVSPLFDKSGKVMGCQAVMEDISERKRSEEELLSARNELESRVEERTAELRSSEEKYKVLVEESFDGILGTKGRRISFVNSRLCQMLGYAKEELEGMDYLLPAHPDYRGLLDGRAQARMAGENLPPRYEAKFQRKDGSVFDAEIHSRAIKEQGEPGVQVWIRDISERKLAENALRESEERFRSAFETSPDPIAISRLSDGVFIEVNKGFTELNGLTREEVIGKSSRDVSIWYDPGDRDRLIAELKKRGHVTNLEARFRQRDGEVRAGLMSASIIVLGGEPHILTVTRDVEDWKKAELALRESEEKYRELFEQSMDAVYITTREGILVDANQAFLDLFGFCREEARNMDILKIYADPSERRRLQEEIERKGSLKDYEITFRKNDGTKIEGLLTSTVRRDKDGTVLGYHGIVRDVTGLKQIQRQLLQAQKMEAVGTLAGGIAHDFNNLLQAILGYTDLILTRTKKTDPNHKKLEIVRQAARDGGDLVSRLLAVSMKAEFNARPIDLNQEILKVEKLLRRTIPRMIAIDLVLADDLWIIDSDSAQVEQVLINLAVNAQHAMPDGGRLLIETSNVSLGNEYMRSHVEVRPGNYVLLIVSDTGTGMKPEVVDRIFEPFFTTKTGGEGTGLGLAMVHGIISQHGGYIRCYSEPGLGTSFKIYFPVSETERLLDMAMTRELPAFGTETILLVDDDNRIRDVAQAMIEMGGYKVIATSSGEEALETYADHKSEISLVILDLIMPGMGGKRCLEELLRIDPDARVLFASGYSSNGLTFDETGTGARGFIRKPYDAKDILTAIREVLDRGYL